VPGQRQALELTGVLREQLRVLRSQSGPLSCRAGCVLRNRCPADASRINLDAGGYYAELLPVRERVSGPEHLDTLAARSGLARWTQEADGDADPGVK
jgi:hypothetical protein